MAAAAAALKQLQEVLKGPNRPVVYTPPEMVPQWQPQFAQKLKAAVAAALDAGVSSAKVYQLLDSAAAVDLDALPEEYLAMAIEAGLGADTAMLGDTETLLHYTLNTQCPIPLGNINDLLPTSSSSSSHSTKQPAAVCVLQMDEQASALLTRLQDLQSSIPARHNAACGSVTLAELLRRGATPDLMDSAGNTALHMVVACMVSKKHFPDPSVVNQQRAQQFDEEDEQQFYDSSAEDPSTHAAGARAGQQQESEQQEQRQQQLHDHDGARAAYAAAAFTALLQAGWDPAVRNDNGYSVSDLILEGLSRYQTELSDLRDPEGVAQTTVSLLSQKAPEKGLQQFLDAKIAGVAAVVDALLLMHRLASTVERPRKTRSVLSLVVLWLALLLACVWWIYGRR